MGIIFLIILFAKLGKKGCEWLFADINFERKIEILTV